MEQKFNEVNQKIQSLYEENLYFSENVLSELLHLTKDIGNEFEDSYFKENLKQMQSLHEEISALRKEMEDLRTKEHITLGSLVKESAQAQYKSVIERTTNLFGKIVNAVSSLYENIKTKLNDKINDVQKEFLNTKAQVIIKISGNIKEFLKTQQNKLDNYITRLDEIEKNQKFKDNTKENEPASHLVSEEALNPEETSHTLDEITNEEELIKSEEVPENEDIHGEEHNDNKLNTEIELLKYKIKERQLDLYYSDSWEQSGQISDDIDKLKKELEELEKKPEQSEDRTKEQEEPLKEKEEENNEESKDDIFMANMLYSLKQQQELER